MVRYLVAGCSIFWPSRVSPGDSLPCNEARSGPQKPARPPQSVGQSQRLPTMFNGVFQQVIRHIRILACDDADPGESSSSTSTPAHVGQVQSGRVLPNRRDSYRPLPTRSRLPLQRRLPVVPINVPTRSFDNLKIV